MPRSQPIRFALLLAAFGFTACSTPPAASPEATQPDITAQALVGKWVVDLRAAPGDEAYTQPFVVTAVNTAERSIAGSFYNSDITWSRTNTAWGKVVVTFLTSDGQGDYVHTATLQGDVLTGSSTARHRNMLVPWTATRQP